MSFAAHFEPSTAIGGDYYDLLPMIGDGRLGGRGRRRLRARALGRSADGDGQVGPGAVVRGGGPAGEILRRLHLLMRERLQSADNGRGFVTATLSVVDSATGELVVTNAGHPPTYLLRRGEVTEIICCRLRRWELWAATSVKRACNSRPTTSWCGSRTGLIEATGARQEDFGYDRIISVLTGLPPEPVAVRDRLLEAVAQPHRRRRPRGRPHAAGHVLPPRRRGNGPGRAVEPQLGVDAPQVVARLTVGRHAAVALDGALAGVVGGEHVGESALEALCQPAQVAGAGVQVLPRLEDLASRAVRNVAPSPASAA